MQGWWKAFNDPALNALVELALRDNLDLQQAALRLRAARALAGASHAEFLPQLNFRTLSIPTPQADANYFQAGFDARWELGLFGRAKAAERIATARAGTAAIGLQSARVSLVAEVVRTYLQLRGAQVRESLLQNAAQATQRKLALIRVRERLRLASQRTIENAMAHVAVAQAELTVPRVEIAQHAQTMALLLGRSEPDAAWLKPQGLPVLAVTGFTSVPADLLRTRPEIARAQQRVLEAVGQLGLAKADRFPSIGLEGAITFAAQVSGVRLGRFNNTSGLGPVIDIPLFDWGVRRATEDARDAELKAALLDYRQAVLHGALEVESALVALNAQNTRETYTAQAEQALQRGAQLGASLRKLGQSDALDLADAQLALSKAKLEHERAREARDIAFVALYKALGGAPLFSREASH